MHYADFENQITRRYAVVCENWPLSAFESPHHLQSLPELNVLLNSWVNGVTRFRKLSAQEHETWMKEYDTRTAANQTETIVNRTDSEGTIPVQPLMVCDVNANAPPLPGNPAPPSHEHCDSGHDTMRVPAIPSVTTNTGEQVPARSRKCKVDVTFVVEGEPVKKTRAKRSDAGKKRGPYKKKGETQSAGSLPVNSETQQRPARCSQASTSTPRPPS